MEPIFYNTLTLVSQNFIYITRIKVIFFISETINSIISYAPNFVKMLGSFNANVDLNFKKKYKTIFDVQTKNPISSKVI